MTHIQYDLAAAEAKMRADVEALRAMQPTGASDPAFVQAQREFDETRIQFTLACMRSENLGRTETLAAAGFAIGQMWTSALQGTVGVRERGIVNGWVCNALMATFGQAAMEKTMESVFSPMTEQ